MHEFSLMKDLIGKIVSLARQNDARREVSVSIRLGALCHISAQHCGEHLREAASGTVAESGRLEMVETRDEPFHVLAS
jgi:hydrogenase nickel incorporation protein HypA/HybF